MNQINMTTSNFKSYIIILSAVLVALIVNPYSYGHSNHGQEIPPILSLLDQNLFLKDFAIQSYLEINPRYFWQLLIYYMQDIFDLSIPGSLLLILLFSSTSFFAAIFFISKILLKTNVNSGKDLSQLFLIFSYVSIMAMLPLLSWGSKIFYFEAIPSTLGMGVAIWSFYFALQEKWMPAYLICSISIFFHFIIGIFAGLVIFPLLVKSFLSQRSAAQFLLIVFIWLVPALYVYLNMLNLEGDLIYEYDLFEVFGLFRVPHHWVPSTASPIRWLSDFVLLLGGIFCLLSLRKAKFSINFIIFLFSVILVSCLGILINYVFVEVYQSEFIGKLQFQRIIPFGHLALFFSYALYLIYIPRTTIIKKLIALLIFVYPLLTVLVVNVRDPFEFILAPISLFLIFAVYLIFSRSSYINNIYLESITLSALILITFILYFKSDLLRSLNKDFATYISQEYNFLEHKEGAYEVYEWIYQNTDKDELILAAPLGTNFFALMQLQSKRSVYLSHKNIPYTKQGIFEWAHRFENLINHKIHPFMTDLEIFKAWKNNPAQHIEELAYENSICYIIDLQRSFHQFNGKIVLTESRDNEVYLLWKLDACRNLE